MNCMKKICFVLNTANKDFQQYWNDCPNKPWQGQSQCRRVVILWAGVPISPVAILSWRCGLIEEGDLAYRFLFLPQKDINEWHKWLENELGDDGWLALPGDEDVVFATPDEQKWEKAALQLGVDIETYGNVVGSA